MIFRFITIVLIGLWSFAGVGQAYAASGAQAEVKSVLDKAMEIQTRPDLEGDAHVKERTLQIRKLIADNFLTEDMAKDTIKEQWGSISEKQRSEFQSLFKNLFQDSYTRMVLNFLKKENVEYPGEQPAQGGGELVKTVIMRINEHIPVDYTVVQKGGRWLIRDVDIDGVSIVGNYRNAFHRVIKAESFDGLLKKMRTQSQALASGAGS